MPSIAAILWLFADLTSPTVYVTRVHGHTLPFAVLEDQPHYLIEKEGWIVYIGWPADGKDGPIFRMARSHDEGAHWKVSDFEYDWYPRKVRIKNGRLDIHFIEEDCMSDYPRRLEGPLGGRLREPKGD